MKHLMTYRSNSTMRTAEMVTIYDAFLRDLARLRFSKMSLMLTQGFIISFFSYICYTHIMIKANGKIQAWHYNMYSSRNNKTSKKHKQQVAKLKSDNTYVDREN